MKNVENLEVGDNVSIHAGCYIDAAGGVEIGNNVSIAHQSSIVAFEHTWGEQNLPIKYNKTVSSGVLISSDVWIGCGVRVLDGSRIDERVVVAAGAVVKGRLASRGVYGGVPVRRLKSI
ncbi:putative acetyltransferase [compost metagenome]